MNKEKLIAAIEARKRHAIFDRDAAQRDIDICEDAIYEVKNGITDHDRGVRELIRDVEEFELDGEE